MKRLSIYLFIIALSNLRGQEMLQNLPVSDQISSTKAFNLDEIKVRWKKNALENCIGAPCLPTNPIGPTGSTCASASCPTSSVTDVDGNVYNTVLIGTQCWLKENLRVTKYNDNSNIQSSTTPPLSSSIGERIILQNRSMATVDTLGFLYNWFAATDLRGICPIGWHMPSADEWQVLRNFLGDRPGTQLKENNTNYWDQRWQDTPTNSSGFSARGSGIFYSYISRELRESGRFWSNISYDNDNALVRTLFVDQTEFSSSTLGKGNQISIRCLKD